MAAVRLASFIPWINVPQDAAHAQAAEVLSNISIASPSLGNHLVQLEWVADGVTDGEARTLGVLGDIVVRDSGLADHMAYLPWITDGIASHEIAALLLLADKSFDPESVKSLVSYYWVKNGLNATETSAMESIVSVAKSDAQVASHILSLPWVANGITRRETEGLAHLRSITTTDPDTASILIGYPWLVSAFNFAAVETLYGLARTGTADPALAKFFVESPWIADAGELTPYEAEPIERLSVIAAADPLLARKLGELLSARFGHRNREVINFVTMLLQEKHDVFEQLTNQNWFADGLDDGEAAFLAIARDIIDNCQGDFEAMMQTRYTQSETVALPNSGEVNIWAIQKAPFPPKEAITGTISRALLLMDEMMGVPLPTSDIIVLVVVTGQEADYEVPYSTLAVPWPRAAHAGSHVRMSRYETEGISESTLYHELAHYYFNFFPAWLLEGGPQFMSAYVLDRTGTAPIEERFLNETIKSCREAGIANLHELGEPWLHYRVSPVEGCFYSMEEHFLTSLHLSLGKEVMSSALTDIHSRNLPPTAQDIYLAFQRNVPAGKQEEFHDLFGQLYGGPLANVDVNVPDDHGDNRLSATPITPGMGVLGIMDHPFDTDYFSFLAEGLRNTTQSSRTTTCGA